MLLEESAFHFGSETVPTFSLQRLYEVAKTVDGRNESFRVTKSAPPRNLLVFTKSSDFIRFYKFRSRYSSSEVQILGNRSL